MNTEVEELRSNGKTMWGRLPRVPVRRTFQSGLGATGKSPQLADMNVCPTEAALERRWPTSELGLIPMPSNSIGADVHRSAPGAIRRWHSA